MESESLASRKEKLQESSMAYKEAIETQIKSTERIGKVAIIAGGILFAGYKLFQLMGSKGKKKRNVEPVYAKTEVTGRKTAGNLPKLAKKHLSLPLLIVALTKLEELLTESEPDER